MQTITITESQIRLRDLWIQKLINGECTLNEAIFMCMCSGAPFSQYLIDEYERAFMAYQYGEEKNLARAFGAEISDNERRKQRTYDRDLAIYYAIEANETLPKLPAEDANYENSIFHSLANEYKTSTSNVKNIYYKMKKHIESYD